MTENTNTPFDKRCDILADLWMNLRNDDNFKDFIEYNDLGLPLAYSIASGIIGKDNESANNYINEAWGMLLQGFETEDTGFETLDEILSIER